MANLTNPNNMISVQNLNRFRENADGFYGGFAMLMPFLADSTYVTKSIISNPEFYAVILDSQDKIIAGVRRDMTYVGLDIPDAIEAIVDVIADIANT